MAIANASIVRKVFLIRISYYLPITPATMRYRDARQQAIGKMPPSVRDNARRT
jgi:hypothetical protein